MHEWVVEERLEWGRWVTPKPLREKPIHRWHVFPHSFTSELVQALIDEWGLSPDDHILDPFAGAGTTLLAAKEREIPATGFDLSPLAVLAARTKVTDFDVKRLEAGWEELKATLDPNRWTEAAKDYPELVRKALPGKTLAAFDSIGRTLEQLPIPDRERDFFRLALLRVLPDYSRAVPTGGWLKWFDKDADIVGLPWALETIVRQMISDVQEEKLSHRARWHVAEADARELPSDPCSYSAVITSPPYPNRHDYTRVFGVELMFAFLSWEETRQLRYQSFHSHPEARPKRPDMNGYMSPQQLSTTLTELEDANADPRVVEMLRGYFLDIYLCLREMRRVCREDAHVALVVGNAQYSGRVIAVDELTAMLGEQAGLVCERLVVARYRGNSAQQMGKYGRNPSRESVVMFRKPAASRSAS